MRQRERDRWMQRDLAWAAGLFEGEGCVSLDHRKRRRRDGTPSRGQPRISMRQAGSPEVLERFRDIVGMGRVGGPYATPGGNKPMYSYELGTRAGVESLCKRLYPYLGERRKGQVWEKLDWGEVHRVSA